MTDKKTTDKKIVIRTADISDAPMLLDIYSFYVENTAITFEYEVPTLEEFEERVKDTLKKYPYLVAEMDGRIVGYSYVGAFKSRAAYDWAVETTVYVHKDYKGIGIGKSLYEAIESITRKQNILNLEACIAYPAEGAEDAYLTKDSVLFHEKMGYRMVGEFCKCGYKFDKWYNMVWMEKHLGEHKVPQPPIILFSNF